MLCTVAPAEVEALLHRSQPGQTTPTPAPQVTTVKSTQFESVCYLAPLLHASVVTQTATAQPSSVSTQGGGGGGGGASVVTAARGPTNATAETPPIPQVKTTAGAAPPPPTGGARATAAAGMAASAAQVKATSKDPAKVQVEVAPPPAKAAKEAPALDPFDALANILPSETPLVLPEPVYTGPEVHEHGITAEEGILCGVREDTLPPNYRFANVKPMSTDEALDSLSFGFVSAPAAAAAATPAKQEKMDAGFSNFAAPPSASVKSPAPPADKKAKIDTVSESFSLVGALSSPAPPQKPVEPKPAATTVPEVQAPAPTVPKVQAPAPTVPEVQAPAPTVPKVQAPVPTCPRCRAPAPTAPEVQAPVPTAPKVQAPAPTVPKEAKVEEEEGVLVGVREDTLPPGYRFSEEKLKDLPAPKPEPTLAPGEALDFLSGDFTTAPVVHAPVIPSAPPAQEKVENLSALDELAGDFMIPTQAAVVQAPLPPPAEEDPKRYRFSEEKLKDLPAPKPEVRAVRETFQNILLPCSPWRALDFLSGDFTTAPIVHAPVIPSAPPAQSEVCDSAKPNKTTEVTPEKPEAKPALKKDDSLSLDAFSALSDTLAAPEPAPEPPKLRPEEIVSEANVEEEEGVLVGVREDTLPPGYRFSEEKLKDLPAPKPEPTLNTGEALDFLSGDFMTPTVCPPAHALPASTQPPAAPSMSVGTTSALDALSDTLADIKPVPEPAPVPMKDTAKEKKIKEERLKMMGEDDDTLPPEYRPTEEDLKAMAKAKEEAAKAPKEKPMGEAAALDLLSGDFALAPGPAAPVAAPAAVPSAPCLAPAPVLQPPVLPSEPLKPMAGPALDSLAGTLLPSAMEAKTKGDKPKKHHAEDPSAVEQHSAGLSTDVVSAKKGGKS
ncbi:hypothetical protein CRUP_015034 [Coryphaenoides rupestris]|nr:hypothetical protein CRUP_015034 [Coryphaenoides rupestris]